MIYELTAPTIETVRIEIELDEAQPPLAWLRDRLQVDAALILGLSVHRAKGREWDTVGLALKPSHIDHLSGGLSYTETTHRELYVACTRARVRTVAL